MGKFDKLVEITLKKPEDFLKIKETLTRIGVPSHKQDTLYQSCHILHKQGRYAIVHFKEMFDLDGKPTDISEEDLARRNSICKLLEQWDLIVLVDPEKVKEPIAKEGSIKIIPFRDKSNWKLVSKYAIGKKVNTPQVPQKS